MSTKSNPKTAQTRKRSASNPANFGITQIMRARSIIEISPAHSSTNDLQVIYDPVRMTDFYFEVLAMQKDGYTAVEVFADSACSICKKGRSCHVSYSRRHANGKPNYDTSRDFEVCYSCGRVTETAIREQSPEEQTQTTRM